MTDLNRSQDLQLQMARRRVAAAEQGFQKAVQEREMFLRLCVCLANAHKGECDVGEVGGYVAIPASDVEQVPLKWRLDLARVDVEEEGVEDAEQMEMFVFKITPKSGGNGSVEVPEQPRIVIP